MTTTNIISKADAARRLGVSTSDIEALIAAGELREASFENQSGVWGFDILALQRKARGEEQTGWSAK